MDAPDFPDNPTPKDIAMINILKRLEGLKRHHLSLEDVQTLAEDIGWVQYSCSSRRHEKYIEQYAKIIDRFMKKLTETLEKRGITKEFLK